VSLSLIHTGLLDSHLFLGSVMAPVRLLRAAHTGSVNDYAAYAVAGMLAVIAVLTLT
jgi:hypothetical protein